MSDLQNRFGTANRAEVYMAQLKNRVRQRNETIPELAQNIRKLTRQAYPGANSDLIDTLALDHFIDSLLDAETRLRLRECSPKTIQEAETLAVKLEAQRLADRQRSKNVGSLSETSEDRNFSNDMRKLSETVNGLVESVEHLQKKQEPTDFHPRNEHRMVQIVQTRIGHRDLIKTSTTEIGWGTVIGTEIGRKTVKMISILQGSLLVGIMVKMTRTLLGILLVGILMADLWDNKMIHPGLNSRETGTGQVWGSQLDLGECKIRNCTAQ